MEAIKHGKHVLVEKPIAFTLKEAEDMIAAAKEAGVILATGHVERFNPAVQKLKNSLIMMLLEISYLHLQKE